MQTPTWVHDAVFYQIFPDRFARGVTSPSNPRFEPWDAPPTFTGFKGGDLWGVLERLDYLQDLGITAIYFNPIFQSAANHRYHTHDYYRVDPLLGGDEAFRALLDEAHRRSIRIVLDGVFNHAGRGFFQFNHILENGASSPYLAWFHVYGFPLHAYDEQHPPNYAAWWGMRALPKFNTDTPDVREFLWRVGEYWIEQGIDGWRLDVPNEITTPGFWETFRDRVKRANPNAYLVGEIWDDATPWLDNRFDAVMNYLFTKAVLGFFIGDKLDPALVDGVGYAPLHPLDAEAFAQAIETLLARYPREATYAMLNVLGSHDTPRIRTLARGNTTRLKLALFYQMTYPGAPCLYYGDEIGMEGGKDPDNRRGFPWLQREAWDTDVLAWTKRCIRLRHVHGVLRHGAYRTLYAQGDVVVYARFTGHEVLVLAVNRGTQTVRCDVPIGDLADDGALFVDIWNGGAHVTVQNRVLPELRLAPGEAGVWQYGMRPQA